MASRSWTAEPREKTEDSRYRDEDFMPRVGDPRARQAYRILQFAYVVAPIVAGVDKFFNRLTDWSQYLAPVVASAIPFSPRLIVMGAGCAEVLVGLLVAVKPGVGATLAMVWLWGVIANLLLIPGHYDIALRDFGLSLGALALARLARSMKRSIFAGI